MREWFKLHDLDALKRCRQSICGEVASEIDAEIRKREKEAAFQRSRLDVHLEA